MTYYCTHCLKYHADNYKKHWQYKKVVEIEEDPRILERIARLEKTQEKTVAILKAWKIYIERKHPYTQSWLELFIDL